MGVQTGNAGKWKTPHHQAKQLEALQPGDQGIWVTCARHQEMKASREVMMLFSEVCHFHFYDGIDGADGEKYAEKIYGIKGKEESDDEDEDDVEAAIQKQVAALNAQGTKEEEDAVFTPMKMNIDCV